MSEWRDESLGGLAERLERAEAELARQQAIMNDMTRDYEAENARLREALEQIVKDMKVRHFDCLDVCPERNVYAIARNALKEKP